MLQSCLARLVEGTDLSVTEAREAMGAIMSGQATEAQIAGFLVALRMKGETVDEITGCALAMRSAATPIDAGGLDVVDTCGTGGTRKGTLNVSTAAALVSAGAGVPVAKHGNRGASASWGSADVLEALGVDIDAEPAVVERCIREAGIGFLFAPALHKAMRFAIGPRRQLAVRTVFNILGPLTNPSGARRQLLGVFAEELVEPMARVLMNLGAVRAMVVHSRDGMDEISLCAETVVADVCDGAVTMGSLRPEDLGLARARRGDLVVGGVRESVRAIRGVLDGRPGPHRDMVLLNAGAAICVGGRAESVADGMRAAAESVESGAAREALRKLIEVSHQAAS